MAQPTTIQKIEENGISWTNVSRIGSEEMKYLEQNFNFHPLHLADCFSPLQRPKLDVKSDYLFMVLLFPVYKRKTRKILTAEVDFFVGKNFLVTVHNDELPPLINFFNLCQVSEEQRQKYFNYSPARILYEILNRLCLFCQPILDDLQLAVADIEEHIQGYEKRMVREILVVKRNLINFRQIIRVHQSVINEFINKGEKILPLLDLKLNFLELVETAGDIWGVLENLYQTIGALEQTNNSLISFRLGDIMRILTIISVIVLPISVVANLVNIITNTKQNAWAIVSPIVAVVVLCLLMILYFKKKQWL